METAWGVKAPAMVRAVGAAAQEAGSTAVELPGTKEARMEGVGAAVLPVGSTGTAMEEAAKAMAAEAKEEVRSAASSAASLVVRVAEAC